MVRRLSCQEENDLWTRMRGNKKFDRQCESRDDIVRKLAPLMDENDKLKSKIDSLEKKLKKRDVELGKIFAKAIRKEILIH